MPSKRESSHWWPDLPLAFPPATPEFCTALIFPVATFELALSNSSFRVLLLMNHNLQIVLGLSLGVVGPTFSAELLCLLRHALNLSQLARDNEYE